MAASVYDRYFGTKLCDASHIQTFELSNEKGDPYEFIDYNGGTNGEHRSVYHRSIKPSNKQVPSMRWTCFKSARRFK